MGKVQLPLKTHGGKAYLAKKIIELMPPHLHYVEPYFGGGAVLLNKDPNGVSEVVNDLNYNLTIFWKVLQDKKWFKEFKRIIEATPFSQNEWYMASDSPFLGTTSNSYVEKAVKFFVRCRQSRAGQCKDFATLTKNRLRRNTNEQASAWWSAVEGLESVYKRLKNVVILNRHALDVIAKEDSKNTLFYCDPPYYPDTRVAKDVYEHEMSEDDHKNLLMELDGIKGKFILSGYNNYVYDDYARRGGWNRADFNLPNNAAGGDKKRRMIESCWTNY
jgi:DNA adenine methylase